MFNAWVFFLFFIAIIFCDCYKRRIPNVIVVLLMFFGIVFSLLEVSPFGIGFKDSLLTAGIAFVFLIPFYLMKWMGAGDIKLAMAMGACLGWELLLTVWIFSSLVAMCFSLFAKSYIYFPSLLIVGDRLNYYINKKFPYGAVMSAVSILVIFLHEVD